MTMVASSDILAGFFFFDHSANTPEAKTPINTNSGPINDKLARDGNEGGTW